MTGKKHRKFDIRHKETLTLFLREYFELFFPDLAQIIQFKTARFLDKELIALFGKQDEGTNDRDQHRITDALILVQILVNEKLRWIMIHWEQQGTKPKQFEERMFHYFCGIYFKYRKLVFPIAMFTDPANWRVPVSDTFNLSLPGHPICEFTYHLIKLKKFKAEEFEKQIEKNPLAAAYLPLTDYPKKERPAIKAKAVQGIAKTPPGPKQATLLALIEESIRLNREEEKRYNTLIQNDYREVRMLQSVEEVYMDKWMEKGMEKGVEKGVGIGLEKGALQTSQKYVVDTLNIRFKHIPESLVQKIQSFNDKALLDRLHTEAILAESVEAFARFVEKKGR